MVATIEHKGTGLGTRRERQYTEFRDELQDESAQQACKNTVKRQQKKKKNVRPIENSALKKYSIFKGAIRQSENWKQTIKYLQYSIRERNKIKPGSQNDLLSARSNARADVLQTVNFTR